MFGSERRYVLDPTGSIADGMVRVASEPCPVQLPGLDHLEEEQMVDFLCDRCEVTNAEYRVFRGSHRSGTAGSHSLDGDPQPAVNVSWEDAVGYLNWLSQQDGLPPAYERDGDRWRLVTPPTTGYRLPTEAEWAYVARHVLPGARPSDLGEPHHQVHHTRTGETHRDGRQDQEPTNPPLPTPGPLDRAAVGGSATDLVPSDVEGL